MKNIPVLLMLILTVLLPGRLLASEYDATAKVLSTRIDERGWAYVQFEVAVQPAAGTAEVTIRFTVNWTSQFGTDRRKTSIATITGVRNGMKQETVKLALDTSIQPKRIDSVDITEVTAK